MLRGADVSFDPILLEVISGALQFAADEMGYVLGRTAYSNVVYDTQDFNTSLLAPDASLVASGSFLPLHVGVMPEALEHSLRRLGAENLREGDILISNDPFRGGTHLPDVMLFKPVFDGERLLGYAANLAHWADVGGRVLGGMSCDATEMFQEGLLISPAWLYREGRLDETLIRMIRDNVRLPEEVFGDLMAQVAACETGARRLRDLAAEHGADTLDTAMAALQAHSERRTREALAALPRGVYVAEDYLDNDGLNPEPVRIRVAVRTGGDHIEVDFTGSHPQTEGPVNCTLATTRSCVYFVVHTITDPSIPDNAGCHRPVTINAPEGSVVNPRFPAGTGPRAATYMRVTDALYRALAQALPDRIPAACDGTIVGSRIYGRTAAGGYFWHNDGMVGGIGGRPGRDGVDGVSSGIVNYQNRCTEELERRSPILVEHYGLVPDSGGAGQYRGGLGIQRNVRLLADAHLTIRNEREKIPAWGLNGGKSGATSAVLVNGQRINPKSTHLPLRKGDLLTMRTAGAGGWGDPSCREIAAVERDVQEGKISPDRARTEYGYPRGGVNP
ncbi:MAG: hydantoinase B/oxoprolinase family protein [Chloroflexi bacterium]|nr:hydantoinase B/oxoprolinase family protein [Chloroflexota bacterium]